MTANLPLFKYSDSKLLEPKALAAWRVLEGRYLEQLSSPEVDHLYALYILGLTLPFFGDHEPMVHLDACRSLLKLTLPAERAEEALCKVPAASEDWVRKAFLSIEQLGARDGRALFDRLRNPIPESHQSGPSDALAADKNNEENHA